MSNVPAPKNVKADPKRPYKAVAAFVGLVLGLLWANLAGRETLNDLTTMEWLSVIVPTILTTLTVYGVENPKILKRPYRDDRGAVDAMTALLVVFLIVVILLVLGVIR